MSFFSFSFSLRIILSMSSGSLTQPNPAASFRPTQLCDQSVEPIVPVWSATLPHFFEAYDSIRAVLFTLSFSALVATQQKLEAITFDVVFVVSQISQNVIPGFPAIFVACRTPKHVLLPIRELDSNRESFRLDVR